MSNQAVLPRRSRRLATIIPASQWISIGYSNEDAQVMVRLQNDMKKYYDGSEVTKIEIRGRMPIGEILPHHDLMIPHWKKLFKAINGRTNSLRITIRGISLPGSVLDIIFPTLQTTNLDHMLLLDVRLGNEGLLRLSSFLKTNTSIKNLCIGGERIRDLSIANSLSDAVKGHQSLDGIAIVKCGLGANVVGKVLEGCTGLNSLGISHEKLGQVCVNFIADFISGNHAIEVLRLSYNKLSDNDALVLASALKENTNLRQLDLTKNRITEEGEEALLEAMYDPTSMDSIIDLNHTCIPYTYDIDNASAVAQRPLIEREVFMINGWDISIQQKIRKKVVLALCGVDGELFDLSHLNDLPLQLMPRVLELIQEHTSGRTKAVGWSAMVPPGHICPRLAALIDEDTPQLRRDALTRLFHTLRGWELPRLFENLRGPSATRITRKRKTRR